MATTEDFDSRAPVIATAVMPDDRLCLIFYPLMKLDRLATDRRTVRRTASSWVLVELVSRSFKSW